MCEHETCATNRALSTQPTFSCLFNASAPMTTTEETTMSRTAEILAEMRAENSAANADFAETVDDRVSSLVKRNKREGVIRAGNERYSIATGTGRKDATLTAHILLKGTENIVGFSNSIRREFSLPARALSMASSKGRCTPDMLVSLMSYFSNPSDMASTLLASFLPTKVSLVDAKRIVAERAEDEGWGAAATQSLLTDLPALLKSINPNTGRNGGAPSRVRIADGVTPPTVDAKRRGRPSGPKYVAWLPFAATAHAAALLLTGDRPVYGCVDVTGVPGGNDVAQGAGHAGTGWDTAWAKGRTLSPSQSQRRNAALDEYNVAAHRMAAAEQAE